jgi:hypothetical protein
MVLHDDGLGPADLVDNLLADICPADGRVAAEGISPPSMAEVVRQAGMGCPSTAKLLA